MANSTSVWPKDTPVSEKKILYFIGPLASLKRGAAVSASEQTYSNPAAFEGEVLDHTPPTSDGLVGQPNAQFYRWALPELTQHTVKMEHTLLKYEKLNHIYGIKNNGMFFTNIIINKTNETTTQNSDIFMCELSGKCLHIHNKYVVST